MNQNREHRIAWRMMLNSDGHAFHREAVVRGIIGSWNEARLQLSIPPRPHDHLTRAGAVGETIRADEVSTFSCLSLPQLYDTRLLESRATLLYDCTTGPPRAGRRATDS